MFAREALFSLASAVGTSLQVDKATTGKSRPSVARVKVEVNLLLSLPDRVRMFFKDEKIGVVKEVLQKIVYDKLPSYCTTCKHQGHKEEECTLTMEIEGGLINETKINREKFEGDLRSILDEKKKVLSLQQTGKEVTLPNSSNINSGKNSVDNFNKEKHATTTCQERVNAPGLLLLTTTSGHKEDTKAMLLGTLTTKINDQLGAAATGSSTPVHIHVEAQNNADNNSRELIVTSQVAKRQLLSRFGSDGELGSPNAVVVTKSRQDEAKQGTSTAEKPIELGKSNSVVECTQFDVLRDENFGQYEGLHGMAELSAESGNTLDLEKLIEQTGKLKECCHDDNTDQQALVTHEKESIVTEEIDDKEINPNTPVMFISN
ncbi:hypothetical protein MTR67_017737 [Solanum verrucosum]|uniref:DUF4283 domain-containing protein n=1 Tax=Solanum verrucosum TaxID=315347 RepID=A0AAF0TL14_SOLVR|nr:hypothetical protein MTR67_017737 [Solanum verrucosum]